MVSIIACNNNEASIDDHVHDHDHSDHNDHTEDTHTEPDHEEGEVHLTVQQVKTMNITLGDFSQLKINDFVSATGAMGVPPNGITSVNTRANGFIKDSKKYVEGSYVRKDEIMAYLENPEFIQLQQQYLETEAELSFLKLELERQKTLVEASAGVVKNLQKLNSDVSIKTATLKGIGKQLEYLGINVAEMSPDNITERIAIHAPMTGYITSLVMHDGMYVTPEQELMEIINEGHLHLELDVFEKDIAHIKEDQRISYIVPAMGNTVYEGEVHIIGKEFNIENKTVRIHGHMQEERPRFIRDIFVEAKIWLNDHTVEALPEAAIIKDGASSYIYYANPDQTDDEVIFNRVMILPGTTDKGFTSVKLIQEIPDGMKIVTEGAYFVYAQSKAGELKHEH
ncbi:MAG: HlyD family efflux transporter periplasmic adaptor subunit [Bacteroidetes bacterium]|nr:MAG: HlyD family efflux transporter periplasmic adaptor subunit [Bacteroidota bacterium]